MDLTYEQRLHNIAANLRVLADVEHIDKYDWGCKHYRMNLRLSNLFRKGGKKNVIHKNSIVNGQNWLRHP